MPNQPNVTGLSALGEALANGSRDYANIQIADRLRAQQRANQLADVAEARSYAEQESEKARGEHLQDQQKMLEMQAKLQGLQIMRAEGLLPMDRDPTAEEFARASQQFAALGLDKLYKDLLSTPGPDGKPLLTHADLSDPAKVQAAKDALGAINATQLKFSMDQQGNAQSTVNDLAGRIAQRKSRIEELSRKLDEPVKQFGLNDGQVQALAVQLADQAKPGSGRNVQSVTQMLPDAQKMLNDQALMAHAQQLQAVKEQLNAERYAEASDTTALDHAMQAGKVFPTKGAMSAPAALQSPTAAAPSRAASPDQIAAAMRAALGVGNQSASSGSLPVPANADPESQKLIADQNRAEVAMMAEQMIAPLNSREAEIQAEIERVKSVPSETPAPQAIDSELGWMNLPTAPIDQGPYKAKKLSSLYIELKDVQDKKARLKAQQQLTSPLALPPSAPVSPATPATLLSDPTLPVRQKIPDFNSPSMLRIPSWFSAEPAGG